MIRAALALVRAWLVLDFFGGQRERGRTGSSLTSTIFTQAFLSLVVAAVLFDRDARTVPFAAANLSLSTVLVGMGVLAVPRRRERRLADRTLVDTAPLPRATLPLARCLHGAFYIVLVSTGMAIPPAILLGWVADTAWVIPAYLALASLLAGLFAGGLGVAVRTVERAFGAQRAALLAGTLQAVLLGATFIGFALCMPRLRGSIADLPFGAWVAATWPPYWGARWLSAPLEDARFLLAIAGAAVAVFAIATLLGERESRQSRGRTGHGALFRRIDRALCGSGPLLGATSFVAAMLYRSPSFRARVLPLLGVPVAMVLLSFSGERSREQLVLVGTALQFPAIYLPFLVMFLPYGEHAGAGFVFATSPHDDVALARAAALFALLSRIVLPIVAAAALLLLAFGLRPATVATLTVFSASTAVGSGTLALRRLDCMPFTAEDEPAGAEFGDMLALALVLAALGGAFALVAAHAAGFAIAAVALATTLLHLRQTRRRIDAPA